MIDFTRTIACLIIMAMMNLMPAFAEESSEMLTDAEPAADEQISIMEDTCTETGPEEIAEPEEPAQEDDEIQETEEEAAAEEENASADDAVSLIADGRGKVYMTDDGPDYEPARGYELIMITADKSAGEYEAGEEIPEDEIKDIKFEPGTTVTYKFIVIEGDDPASAGKSDSSGARFDGVWDPDTNSIT